jgi:hypothetical protein
MHLSSSPALWYSIRASGVIAFVLLTCTVLVGVGLAGKVRLTRWPRFRVDAVHRYLGTDIVIPFRVLLPHNGTGSRHRRDGAAARADNRGTGCATSCPNRL